MQDVDSFKLKLVEYEVRTGTTDAWTLIFHFHLKIT